MITNHQPNNVVIATQNSMNRILEIFFGNFKVLKSIEKIITIDIANNVIIKEIIDTSENIKNEKIIVNILLTLVYGIITDIFSSLYIFCAIPVVNISINNIKHIKNNTQKSKLLRSTQVIKK